MLDRFIGEDLLLPTDSAHSYEQQTDKCGQHLDFVPHGSYSSIGHSRFQKDYSTNNQKSQYHRVGKIKKRAINHSFLLKLFYFLLIKLIFSSRDNFFKLYSAFDARDRLRNFFV